MYFITQCKMKYIERSFVCTVPHKHFFNPKKYQFCTGETIVNPAKINALLNSVSKSSSWYLFNHNWEILKVKWGKSWNLQPNVKSSFFYFIGNRKYLVDLVEALSNNTVKEWFNNYKNEQFILTYPVFTDSNHKNILWFVSNTHCNKINKISIELCHFEKITVNAMIANKSFTIGSSHLLLYSLTSNYKLSIDNVIYYINNNLLADIQQNIYPYYLCMGNVPMVCDILPECTLSWFTSEEHKRLFPNWNDNETIIVDYPNIFYFLSKHRLQCLDGCPIRDLSYSNIKLNIISNNDTTHPWLYPQWVRLIQETKRGWCLWKKRKWIEYLYHSEFQGKYAEWNFALTTLYELSYLYHETTKYRHRVKVIWKECLDYIRTFNNHDIILKWTIRKYWSKYLQNTVPSLPIYFLNNLNIAKLGLLKELQDDNESRYYLNKINKRIMTKLEVIYKLPYTVGSLMQQYYKEHKDELYN